MDDDDVNLADHKKDIYPDEVPDGLITTYKSSEKCKKK